MKRKIRKQITDIEVLIFLIIVAVGFTAMIYQWASTPYVPIG